MKTKIGSNNNDNNDVEVHWCLLFLNYYVKT